MRNALILLLAGALPAGAWEAGVEGRLCTLSHAGTEAEVRLTYDPAGPVYSITVTRAEAWPSAPRFSIRFEGGAELTIGTDRHVLSQGGRALTVTDRGFGNVLAGLSRNRIATAASGDATVRLDLDGAAPEVEAFRACSVAPAA